jgi:hypothetical protein
LPKAVIPPNTRLADLVCAGDGLRPQDNVHPRERITARDEVQVRASKGNHRLNAFFAINRRRQMSPVQGVDFVVEALDQCGLVPNK